MEDTNTNIKEEIKIEPKNTIYINNLNEKVPINEMRQILNIMFSKYGKVLDIILKRNIILRGQAFVIFDNLEVSKKVKAECNGKLLFKKKIRIDFAKIESDLITKRNGTYKEIKREKKICKDYWNSELYKKKLSKKKNFNFFFTKEKVKESEIEVEGVKLVPNNILFVKDIPNSIIFDDLIEIFTKYPGFSEVRFIPGRKCAFIEFEDDSQSLLVLSSIKDLTYKTGENISITFSKK